jgi:hypothetical protein
LKKTDDSPSNTLIYQEQSMEMLVQYYWLLHFVLEFFPINLIYHDSPSKSTTNPSSQSQLHYDSDDLHYHSIRNNLLSKFTSESTADPQPPIESTGIPLNNSYRKSIVENVQITNSQLSPIALQSLQHDFLHHQAADSILSNPSYSIKIISWLVLLQEWLQFIIDITKDYHLDHHHHQLPVHLSSTIDRNLLQVITIVTLDILSKPLTMLTFSASQLINNQINYLYRLCIQHLFYNSILSTTSTNSNNSHNHNNNNNSTTIRSTNNNSLCQSSQSFITYLLTSLTSLLPSPTSASSESVITDDDRRYLKQLLRICSMTILQQNDTIFSLFFQQQTLVLDSMKIYEQLMNSKSLSSSSVHPTKGPKSLLQILCESFSTLNMIQRISHDSSMYLQYDLLQLEWKKQVSLQ